MSQNMTDEAIQGFTRTNREGMHSDRNPYIVSSSSWEAWQIGRWLEMTGRTIPLTNDVRTSRGSTYHVRDMKVRVHLNGEVTRIT